MIIINSVLILEYYEYAVILFFCLTKNYKKYKMKTVLKLKMIMIIKFHEDNEDISISKII